MLMIFFAKLGEILVPSSNSLLFILVKGKYSMQSCLVNIYFYFCSFHKLLVSPCEKQIWKLAIFILCPAPKVVFYPELSLTPPVPVNLNSFSCIVNFLNELLREVFHQKTSFSSCILFVRLRLVISGHEDNLNSLTLQVGFAWSDRRYMLSQSSSWSDWERRLLTIGQRVHIMLSEAGLHRGMRSWLGRRSIPPSIQGDNLFFCFHEIMVSRVIFKRRRMRLFATLFFFFPPLQTLDERLVSIPRPLVIAKWGSSSKPADLLQVVAGQPRTRTLPPHVRVYIKHPTSTAAVFTTGRSPFHLGSATQIKIMLAVTCPMVHFSVFMCPAGFHSCRYTQQVTSWVLILLPAQIYARISVVTVYKPISIVLTFPPPFTFHSDHPYLGPLPLCNESAFLPKHSRPYPAENREDELPVSNQQLLHKSILESDTSDMKDIYISHIIIIYYIHVILFLNLLLSLSRVPPSTTLSLDRYAWMAVFVSGEFSDWFAIRFSEPLQPLPSLRFIGPSQNSKEDIGLFFLKSSFSATPSKLPPPYLITTLNPTPPQKKKKKDP
ncbi:hypothetical protein VP01_2008g1 [Puccinia sorghi]|uniref:Uncharacterized protein n=1 Tax=Puccinia sorghi TaxID=27349 RepID=A0A0L6VD56_9BASI|nr:hypothetical protein VP01_2008g1 [Puccinia sorghi]